MPGTDTPTPAIAVVTVTYSPGEHLENFLTSIDGAFSGPAPRVLMADNGSVDGSPEAADAAHPEAELLRTGANLGYGGAINYAVARLRADDERGGPSFPDFLLISNPDVVFGPGAIDALVEAAARHPRAGSLGPLIRDPDGTVYPSARNLPSMRLGIGHALLGTVWKANPWTRAYQQSQAEVAERAAGWLSGSCLLVRPEAFAEIGGFDDRYFMYMEDVDFGDRLARAGWSNVYVPTAEIVHAKGHAAGKVPELMLPAHHESAYRFFADRHPGPAAAPLRAAMKVGLAARSRVSVLAATRRRKGE
ncbi:glycosyltransferase family 2 protein [Tsukamurella ocularis]|uniref:glycosyltransferase family 2 protein n=1 Tax=Tsukamurella ocularis TaxID=1970234 RepID=UPI0039F05385